MKGAERTMQCAEVHGGNTAVDHAIVLPDLDVWVFCRPHGDGAEGGDLLFVSFCETGVTAKFYLADVAGHGEEVAPAARSLERVVRRHLDDGDHQSFFASLNREVRPRLFATMVALSYDRRSSRIRYAYAGHPHLLFKPAAAPRFGVLAPGYCTIPGGLADLALGTAPGAACYESEAPFAPGDLAVLYSDGVSEARRPDGGTPGAEGLAALASSCSTASAWTFRRDLLRRCLLEYGPTPFADDASLVVVRRR